MGGAAAEEGAGEEEKGGKRCQSEQGADLLGLAQHLDEVLHYVNFASFLAQKSQYTSSRLYVEPSWCFPLQEREPACL